MFFRVSGQETMRNIPIFARFLIATFVIGIILVASSAWKEMERSKRIEDEVAKLRAEADRIRSENQTLTEKITYFSTPGFKEREAKEKLGMKNKDEEVVSVEIGPVQGEAIPPEAATQPPAEADIPNYKKWWIEFRGKS